MTARRVLSLLCPAVCAAALVGCGGDTLSFDPVANAASTTIASQSERVSFTATMSIDLSSVMDANRADPSQTLQMLMASTDAHPIGFDRVRGVFTTHYTLNVDLGRLAKGSKELGKTYEMLRKLTGVQSYPAEAWID